ncbi:MAG: DUF302 domain-containing protein [Burkholderiales bacterium]|nr:DUF302 domain-containing protein [Burkholderiales bacterium]
MQHFVVNIDVDQAAALLQAAVAAYPMGLVAHINGQANCAKKNIAVPADQILEVFRPDFAIRVWKAEKTAGIDIPLRIYLFDQDGKTHVLFRTPHEVFAPYNNAALMNIAEELAPIFNTLLSALDPYKI